MHYGAILLLAVGLAMDATAVAAARGFATPRVEARHMLLVAGFFGGFQALMPLLGWLLGSQVGPWVRAWDHWIVFVLLGALGVRMLREARAGQSEAAVRGTQDAFRLRVMLALAIATSIDALAAGKSPKPGPQVDRQTSCPEGGPSTLKKMAERNYDYRGQW